MATVVARVSMSLDGFVADPSGAVGPLFDWYRNGEDVVEYAGDRPSHPRRVRGRQAADPRRPARLTAWAA